MDLVTRKPYLLTAAYDDVVTDVVELSREIHVQSSALPVPMEATVALAAVILVVTFAISGGQFTGGQHQQQQQ